MPRAPRRARPCAAAPGRYNVTVELPPTTRTRAHGLCMLALCSRVQLKRWAFINTCRRLNGNAPGDEKLAAPRAIGRARTRHDGMEKDLVEMCMALKKESQHLLCANEGMRALRRPCRPGTTTTSRTDNTRRIAQLGAYTAQKHTPCRSHVNNELIFFNVVDAAKLQGYRAAAKPASGASRASARHFARASTRADH